MMDQTLHSLSAALAKDFGIEAGELRPLKTEGEIGVHYFARQGTDRYFVKVYPGNYLGRLCASQIPYFAPRTRRLSEIGLGSVSFPLSNAKDGWTGDWDGLPFLVFKFLDAKPIAELGAMEPGSALVLRVAAEIGKVHEAGRKLDDAGKLFEPWEAFYRKEVKDNLALVESLKNPEGAWKQLQEAVLPAKQKILERVEMAEKHRRLGFTHRPEALFCHGDPNALNVLVGDDGKLHLVDWDFACMAPAERDLHFFCNRENFEDDLKAYEASTGPVNLCPDLLKYYSYRWELEIGGDRIRRMVLEGRTEEQRKRDLGDVMESWLMDFEKMDSKINRSAKMLADTGRLRS
jgi:thiamine kinase-like enzyme